MNVGRDKANVALRVCILGLIWIFGGIVPVRAQAKLFAYDSPTKTLFLDSLVGGEAWGDVDGDGDLDGVFVGASALHLLVNDGEGRITVSSSAIQGYPVSGLYLQHGVALADLDYDGDLDLVATAITNLGKSPHTTTIRLWENDGKGKFKISKRFSIPALSKGAYARPLAVGDLDGDGDNDIVTSGYRFLWNNGFGVFTEKNPIASRSTWDSEVIRLVDFDKDGRLDIFFGIGFSELWLNDRKGGYKRYWFTAAYWIQDAHFVDFDTDGDLDLVVNSGYSSGTIEVLLNDGKSLVPSQRLGSYRGAAAFSVGDLDGDGDADILAVLQRDFFMNDGKGKFVKTANMMDIPNWPKGEGHRWGSELHDLDGDGDLDVGGLYSSKVGSAGIVLRNRLRHLATPATVALGQPLRVTLIAEHQHTLHLGISLGEVRVPMNPWGDLRIDPATLVRLPGRLLKNRIPGGWNFTVPNNPILRGLTLRFQALDVAPNIGPRAHFTNLMRTTLK